MSTLAYSVVDAFTATPFKGNGAAVVVLDPTSSLPDTTRQLIAAEFNLAETAFVTPINASRGRFGLRWFTPKMEFPLCGHATLASASVLFSTRIHLPVNMNLIEFETLSGVLMARALPDGRIELEFPAGEATPINAALGEKVGQAVRCAFQIAGAPNVGFMGTGKGVSFGKYLLIEVDGIVLEQVAVNPDPLKDLSSWYEVIILTQRGRKGSETFVSRVFCPSEDSPEDPVTGSAHCLLGPYWAKKLKIDGTTEMVGKQVSARSGEVGVVWDRERGICRLRGHTKLVAKGELYLE